MSEKLCALRKIGGGTLTETTLWTNSAPTSAFGQQILSLSDSITNYDFIKIVIRNYTNKDIRTSYIFQSDEFMQFVDGSTQYIRRGAIGGRTTGNTVRMVIAQNATSVLITHNTGVNGVSTDDNGNIPVEIVGMKY